MANTTHDARRPAGRASALGRVFAACILFASGCAGKVAGDSPGDTASDGSAFEGSDSGITGRALPACSWPASLDDAAPRQCSAARAYVACEYPNGAGEDCMSSDPTTCPEASGASCTDLCNPDEYAVGCGGVGPAPSPPLPTGCRALLSGPGGGVSGCCPCGDVAESGTDGSVIDGGTETSDAALPAPDAFVSAFVGPGTESSSICGYSSDEAFVQIGVPLASRPATVTNGTDDVSIDCRIDPSDGGFDIQLSAEIAGANGGTFTAVGTVDASGGTGIQGSFTNVAAGTFYAPDCSITFTYDNAPTPVAGSPVDAGRIWGHMDCPSAVHTGTTGYTCDAHADFLFEDCQ